MKSPLPIPETTFSQRLQAWGNIAGQRESASVYYYSRADFLRRYAQLTKNKDLYKKYFGKTELVLVDLNSHIIEDREDLQKLIISSASAPVNHFILGLDTALIEHNQAIFDYFQILEANHPQHSFLFVFTIDFLHPQFAEIFSKNTTFIQNIIWHPLYDEQDTIQFIEYLCAKWELKLTSGQKGEIIKNCGGHFWLVKQALRYLHSNSNDAKQIFSHEQIQLRCKLIWEHFLPSEQQVIAKIIKQNNWFSETEKHSLDFLLKTGWLIKTDTNFQLSIPVLEKYIMQKQWKFDFCLNQKHQIHLNDINIDHVFSPKEKELLLYFLKHKQQSLTRNDLADYISKNSSESVSDWAIDQLISRLRKKLITLGLPKNTILTKRNTGFSFSVKRGEYGEQ